jgi:hypothetical protein
VTVSTTDSKEQGSEDKVMSISVDNKKKKDKKRTKKEAQIETKRDAEPEKRVRFDMTKNKVTEFFKHGKVATRKL